MEKNKNPIKSWLVANDRNATWLGRQIGLGPSQSAAIVAGRTTASQAQRMAIEMVTGGAIPANGWMSENAE
jgi:hypothetical protein